MGVLVTSWQIVEGDCRDRLREMPERSVQTCVTSPPYFGLRDYGTGEWEGGDPTCDHKREAWTEDSGDLGHRGSVLSANEAKSRRRSGGACRACGATRVDRQIGLEPTPDEFVQALVGVFREVRRVLRDDGTVWLNLGDSYNAYNGGAGPGSKLSKTQTEARPQLETGYGLRWKGAKPKDLLGIPWMVAFALRTDGWYLRSDIIWAKPNPMPESVTDRPTKAHEYLFLLSKGPRYFYDADAIREGYAETSLARYESGFKAYGADHDFGRKHGAMRDGGDIDPNPAGRNKRSVWTVATQPYAGAHFATFPPKLIEPCILAGSSPKACGECGAPWRRVTERVPLRDVNTKPRDGAKLAARQEMGLASQRTGLGSSNSHNAESPQSPEVRTVGWEPSCDHQDDTGSSVVLDPFAGAGTTGMVALRHDRSFIGIELSPDYAQMARDRIRDDAPLLNGFSELAA